MHTRARVCVYKDRCRRVFSRKGETSKASIEFRLLSGINLLQQLAPPPVKLKGAYVRVLVRGKEFFCSGTLYYKSADERGEKNTVVI